MMSAQEYKDASIEALVAHCIGPLGIDCENVGLRQVTDIVTGETLEFDPEVEMLADMKGQIKIVSLRESEGNGEYTTVVFGVEQGGKKFTFQYSLPYTNVRSITLNYLVSKWPPFD